MVCITQGNSLKAGESKKFCFLDGWSRTSHPCTKNEFGVWELTIPYKEDGSSPIPHGSKVKVRAIIKTALLTSDNM